MFPCLKFLFSDLRCFALEYFGGLWLWSLCAVRKAERERQSEKERREDALKEQERKAKAEQDTLDWAQTQEKHAIDKAHREEKMRSIEEREARRKLDEDAKKTEYAQRQEDLRSRAALQLQQKQKEDEKAARCEAEAIELGAEGIRLIKNAEDTLFAVSGTLQCSAVVLLFPFPVQTQTTTPQKLAARVGTNSVIINSNFGLRVQLSPARVSTSLE